MVCRLIAIGTVTGNCESWINNFEIDLGGISADANIPSQSVRNSPSTGCPQGYPLSNQGVQMNALANYGNNTYEQVTWQSPPSLIKRGDCSPPAQKYDFINGTCTLATTYDTEGKYSSLADCNANGLSDAMGLAPNNPCNTPTQVACQSPNVCIDPANYCPPGKVCISISEWAQIENLASQNKNRSCS